MAKQTINIGTAPDDETGDVLRDAFDKTNDNFDELYVASRPYTVYAGLISRAGAVDPTVIVLENNLGSIVWTKHAVSTGVSIGTLSGAFTSGKTFCVVGNGTGSILFNLYPLNTNTLYLVAQLRLDNTYQSTFSNVPIEIRVYP
jgi:hypothetical protein